jgi:methyl-accepting chemotaxis protein
VADGDLSTPVPSGRDDEIGSMMSGVERLRLRFIEMLGAVRVSADAISLASTEIASGNQDLSRRTEETAARLQQTTSAMEQAYGNVREAADATRTADGLATSASQAAERGGAAVRDVVQKMGSICEQQQAHRRDHRRHRRDRVPDQHPGAQRRGRGGPRRRQRARLRGGGHEVRSLAQRSAAAAKEIKDLIAASVEEVRAGSRAGRCGERPHAGDRRRRAARQRHARHDHASTGEQSEGIGHINNRWPRSTV